MKQQQNQGIKHLFTVLMITTTFFAFTQISLGTVFGLATGEFVVIDSDVTWTKSNGPHDFASDVLVADGVALTIDSGVVINLNYYELLVNGTLVAKGTSTDKVRFIDGRIEFLDNNLEAWGLQTSSYSILENVDLDNVYLFNSDQVKIRDIADSDIFWSKADSPHVLHGPFVVDEDITLIVEAGATIDLNRSPLFVNGTLRVLGTSNEKVTIKNGGEIKFGPSSTGWDEQTGAGSIIEYGVLENVNVYGTVPVKICNNIFDRSCIAGESLLLLDNIATNSLVEPSDYTLLRNNKLDKVFVFGSPSVMDNYIKEIRVYDGSGTFSNNIISLINLFGGSPEFSYNTIENITGSDGSPVISYNTIGEIGSYTHFPEEDIEYLEVFSATITNNHVQRGIFLTCRYEAIIANNTIFGFTYSYIHDVYTGPPWLSWLALHPDGGDYMEEVTENATTSGIIVNGKALISGNLVSNCVLGIKGGTTIEENVLFNNTQGIILQGNDVVLRKNKITDGAVGIITGWGPVIIENNYISNQNTTGILVTSPATIINNTIFNSTIGIQLEPRVSANIHYNNLEKNSKYNILLNGTIENIDATNNWWGTTNPQVINSSILDHKNNSTLGTAVFMPFLNESNKKANLISKLPEFPIWIVLPLFLVVTFLLLQFRKKILKRYNAHEKTVN